MTMNGPVVATARRDDSGAAPGGSGAVVLLLLAAAVTALAAVPHLMLDSRFLKLPPSPGRPDVLFLLEVLLVPVSLLIGAGLVIAGRSGWRTWGPALLVGVTVHGLFVDTQRWLSTWRLRDAAEQRTILVMVAMSAAALAVSLGLALAARPDAPARGPQPAWARPAVLIPLQVLAVAAVVPEALARYRRLSDPLGDVGPRIAWPALGVVAAALLTAAATWLLDRPHTALYLLPRVFATWIQPTVTSILGYGEFRLVGGAGPIILNVGAFGVLAAVAVLRASRRRATATATPPTG